LGKAVKVELGGAPAFSAAAFSRILAISGLVLVSLPGTGLVVDLRLADEEVTVLVEGYVLVAELVIALVFLTYM
jgi:hypothetical protein